MENTSVLNEQILYIEEENALCHHISILFFFLFQTVVWLEFIIDADTDTHLG